ncbi:antagonist of KipI [Microbulbifer donghaiensis]|uniref:Antagonist of KipI n=1 Tax=Microbulbifer donghaiensis TaxID=494016 RepID=A0A1M5HSX4_9GAMM|nr:biotin-dependent carboxyltransferase family protein [Microbulbifer donghaiensis]SHG19037.1 antagonist of KipI [Microbulbifer donghaiensis]
MTMRFLRAGLQTSVQDLGRFGLMRYGISRGGAADPMAMRLANLLLGNPMDNPVLEVTLAGPTIEFEDEISVAVVGAHFELTLNEESVGCNEVLQIRRGDILSFGQLLSGARAYIAFSGAMDLPKVFGSCGSNLLGRFGGVNDRAIQRGDSIRFSRIKSVAHRRLEEHFQLKYTGHPQLRVITGAEAHCFDKQAVDDFYNQAYQVSAQSNRMGVRLSGSALDTEEIPQQISSGLCPGTVQIPPDGQPIVSFVEGQTIGGYPRIAHVISADLHMVGQLKTNDRINFLQVTQEHAREILAGKFRLLEQLRAELSG